MFQNIGTVEILVIALVLMILFGAKKIPEFARGLGEAGSEFKKGLKGDPNQKKTNQEPKKDN
ncbi:preprotein translocase [Microgenomates group bacterium RBG_16_45_19]|nr:MAG: preprotein translocase [Microgenomates group bacterium RBG_16_45_19]